MKIFRITKTSNNPLYLAYKIEQRRTILFFFHFYTSPEFAPPHLFKTEKEAELCIWHKYPNAGIQYRTKIDYWEQQAEREIDL